MLSVFWFLYFFCILWYICVENSYLRNINCTWKQLFMANNWTRIVFHAFKDFFRSVVFAQEHLMFSNSVILNDIKKKNNKKSQYLSWEHHDINCRLETRFRYEFSGACTKHCLCHYEICSENYSCMFTHGAASSLELIWLKTASAVEMYRNAENLIDLGMNLLVQRLNTLIYR